MVKIFRISAFLAVVVIITRTGLLVADEAIVGGEKSSAFTHRVSRLIDEALRRRGEIEEAADGVCSMAEAVNVAVTRAIIWMARGPGAALRNARNALGAIAQGFASVGRVAGTVAGFLPHQKPGIYWAHNLLSTRV